MAKNDIHSFNVTQDENFGIVKCSSQVWNKNVYKISREVIKENKDNDKFKRSGIYFLFGSNKINFSSTDISKNDYKLSIHPSIYIGQAIYKEDKEQGILYRTLEKHPSVKDWDGDWTEAILLVSDSLKNNIEKNELDYLENKFWNIVNNSNQYYILNTNKPSCSPISDDNKNNFDFDFDNTRIIIDILGYKGFKNKIIINNDADGKIKDVKSKTKVKKREKTSFSKCGIAIGSKLYFKGRSDITATVIDDYTIESNGEIGSMTKFADKILNPKHSVQGSLYWYYEGKNIFQIRIEREKLGLYK